MQLAFYYAKAGDKVDWLISWITWGPYSHCELVFSDGLWFSSSGRDNGVRYKAISPIPGHWNFIELPLDPNEESTIRNWCDARLGLPYDWLGAARCVCSCIPQGEHRWFCSEICIVAMKQVGMFPYIKAHRTSPNKLFQFMAR